ncbi:MAG: ferritin family protein [Chloroflexi bacterium]|nr:ferritin family protein [Chloroflexota bacterium]
MVEEIAHALGILKRAMQLEQEGHEFYRRAVETTKDEKGQETFAALAEDEQKHFAIILRQYQSLVDENRWASLPEIKAVKIDLSKSLFPKGRKGLDTTFASKSSDRDALLFGLEIENKSYDLYRASAAQIIEPLGKEMFEFLAGEEQGHFNILMMRYDLLFGPVAWRF